MASGTKELGTVHAERSVEELSATSPRPFLALLAALVVGCGQLAAAGFSQPDAKALPNLFVWTDTCNVHVLRDGDAALLINLGDGSVLEHLGEIGVKRVEWVLFTDHHREQNQGASKLGPWRERGTQVAAPEAERALFERPLDFRKMNVSLGDAFTIHGASFVRPPIQPIPLDRTFTTNDTFVWHGREFACIGTRGSSPGGMTYLLRSSRGDEALEKAGNGRQREKKDQSLVTSAATNWIAFSGDVMLDDAKMHTWFDTEWDYGFAAGIRALRVHLLGYNAPPQTTPAKDRPYVLPVPVEDVPLFRATVTTRETLRRATAVNPSTTLRRRGNQVEATVNDIHEVLLLRY